MPLRLYFDQDSLTEAVIDGLRGAAVDLVTSAEAGQERPPDSDQLAFATAEGRTLFSANVGDYSRLHREWMAAGRDHAGIIVRSYQQMPIGDQIRGLRRICAAFEPSTATNLFAYLEAWVRPQP